MPTPNSAMTTWLFATFGDGGLNRGEMALHQRLDTDGWLKRRF